MQALQHQNAELVQQAPQHIVVPAKEDMRSQQVESPQLDTLHQIGATAFGLSRAEGTPQEVWGGLHHNVSLEVGAAPPSASDADQGVQEMDEPRVGYMSAQHTRDSYRFSGPLIIGKTTRKN